MTPICRLLLTLSGLIALSPSAARAACTPPAPVEAPAAPADADGPRLALQALVQRAAERSQALGAAALLAEAARQDEAEARAGDLPQLTLSAQAGWSGVQGAAGPMSTGGQLRPTLTLSAPLWDAGRQAHLTRWREQLAEAARQGQISASQQLALQTVNYALERSRYRLHAQVQAQYVHAVCQLVDSLEQIVAADRGRASELLQARKTLQQVELAQAQTLSQQRLADQRLRRLVGHPLPDPAGLSALLVQLPELAPLQARAAQSAEIAQLGAQGAAAAQLAEATRAGQKPQAQWLVQASRNLVGQHSSNWQAGLSLSVPLYQPAAEPAAQAARLRAEAARLQRDDALDALVSRLAEVHEQAGTAQTRARDVARLVADSQQVREDTVLMWRQLGRRSLFDVISAEGDHFGLRIAYVDALHDSQQSVALLWSLAGDVLAPLR